MIVCALHVCLCCASVYACMHATLRASQGICSGVSVCVRAWVSVFEESACVEMRDSIIIATQSEQRSSGHSKHRITDDRTIDHLINCA